MENVYVKSFLMGTVGAAGAYLLNIVFDYAPDRGLVDWALTWAAFVVGSYFGLKIYARRNSGKSEE